MSDKYTLETVIKFKNLAQINLIVETLSINIDNI